MKKRFSLASAMIADPPNLLLDEILNGLDPAGIAFVRGWVTDLRRQGKAVLLSSHLLTELQALADRVTFVHRGRILRTVDRAALAAAGGTRFRITIDNLDETAQRFLAGLGSVQVDGTTVVLSEPPMDLPTLNAELVRRGYRVSALGLEPQSLESYFLQLIEAAQ
jgi:ABC-2 type transport system ATP-binding protein